MCNYQPQSTLQATLCNRVVTVLLLLLLIFCCCFWVHLQLLCTSSMQTLVVVTNPGPQPVTSCMQQQKEKHWNNLTCLPQLGIENRKRRGRSTCFGVFYEWGWYDASAAGCCWWSAMSWERGTKDSAFAACTRRGDQAQYVCLLAESGFYLQFICYLSVNLWVWSGWWWMDNWGAVKRSRRRPLGFEFSESCTLQVDRERDLSMAYYGTLHLHALVYLPLLLQNPPVDYYFYILYSGHLHSAV